MHIHFERVQKPASYSDSTLSTLTWMGKVPDGIFSEDDGWKLNRIKYYQDGWLGVGTSRGIVGVTFTTCRCKNSIIDHPPRTNYNLRGHRSEVTLVKWNEPYQKLASCDKSGIIFVWIKYEGRWSIELINDRNTQVTDFSWSHDGRMALICYKDGFVLVGSVSGQRYWSSMLNLDSCTISCGIWTPDDQQVIFGTSSGHILVIDVHGTMVAQVSIQEGNAITAMSWSCEKFKMDDSEEDLSTDRSERSQHNSRTFHLAVCFADGNVYIMRNYDDIFPIIIRTGLLSVKIEWSNNGEILAIAGHNVSVPNNNGIFSYKNIIQFYSTFGTLRLMTVLDFTDHPITALTWGHSDKRMFIATGPVLHIAWITKRIASLQLLSRLAVHRRLSHEDHVEQLPLPSRLRNNVSNLFSQTLQCYLPDLKNLRDFITSPPVSNIRLHCTMIRHDDDLMSGITTYVLYLEYLGGLVPILKGKRASKLKPEFIIFDPQISSIETNHDNNVQSNSSLSSPYRHNRTSGSTPYTSSDSEFEDNGCNSSTQSPSMVRHRRRRFRRNFLNRNNNNNSSTESSSSSSVSSNPLLNVYNDDMPDTEKLVLVTSNIWGTKFKILGLTQWLPSQLGSITYRTSLLHLQPRQMTLDIKELGGQRSSNDIGFDVANGVSKFENNNFMSSDSEDEMAMSGGYGDDFSAPIAPLTPKRHIRCGTVHNPAQTVSPEKRTANTFRNGSNTGDNHVRFVPSFTEEFLTLHLNDSQFVSYELSGTQRSQTQNTPNQSMVTTQSSSISTQTSFQSISELLNNLSLEKNTQTTFSPMIEVPKTIEEQTEECFSQISKRFTSELPSSSRTPSSSIFHYNFANKYESMHSPMNAAASSSDVGYHHSISPNVSPPKGLRYKIIKKESPRKASISCLEPDLSRNCDTSGKGQSRRFASLSSPSSTQTWTSNVCSMTLVQCNTNFGETLSLDSKPVMFGNDFKFIDDFEADDDISYTKSSSVMLQKNRTFCHIQTNISDFRTSGDCPPSFPDTHSYANHINHGHTNNRRLTFRASKQSHSFETSDTPLHHSECDTRNYSLDDHHSEKVNKMSSSSCCAFVEDTKIESLGYENVSDNISFKSFNDSIRAKNHYSKVSSDVYPNKTSNFDHNNCTATDESSQIPVRNHQLKKSSLKENGKINNVKSSSPIESNEESTNISIPMGSCNSFYHNTNTSAIASSPGSNISLPASPLMGTPKQKTRRKAQGKGLLYSPMMLRKVMKQKLNYLDCSSEDDNTSDDDADIPSSTDFHDLESFQKAHIRKKFKVKRRGSRIQPEHKETSVGKQQINYREFILHNKAPLWNEVSQVYQLDFGGRVTQESAKNFQIEHQGKQVMQFGRIDGNAYTLDFQYPFSALQALAVALANVTQRLK